MFELLARSLFVCVVGLIVSICLVYAWGRRRRRQQMNAGIADRDPLTSDQFAEQFFAESIEKQWVAKQLYEFVAERRMVDASRIRPTDPLKKIGICFADNFELAWTLEARFGLNFCGADEEKMEQLDKEVETFADLVDELIAAKHQPWPIQV